MPEQTVEIRLEKVPQSDMELMYRTVSAAVNRLLRDPKMQADFEAWRERRK